MSRPSALSLIVVSLWLLCVVASPAAADPVYNVSGALQIAGNSGCVPATCTEKINFNLTIAPFQPVPGGDLFLNVSFDSVTSSGPIVGFTGANPDESINSPTFVEQIDSFVAGSCSTPYGYCAEIDFGFVVTQIGSGYTFSGFGAQWFTCEGTTCGPYFTASGLGCFGYSSTCYAPITADSVTFSAVPEPGSLTLFLVGFAGLVGYLLIFKVAYSAFRNRTSRPSFL